MQKYEKLEKIGEGNGTRRCSCKIFFCIPCISGSSTISNAHRLRPQRLLQPRPRAQHPVQTPTLPLAFPAETPPGFSTPCRPDLPAAALPACPAPSLSTACRTPPTPGLGSGSRRPTSTFLPVHIPLPDPCSLFPAPQSTAFIIDPTWQPQPLPAAHPPRASAGPLLCHVPIHKALPHPALTLTLFPYFSRHRK